MLILVLIGIPFVFICWQSYVVLRDYDKEE